MSFSAVSAFTSCFLHTNQYYRSHIVMSDLTLTIFVEFELVWIVLFWFQCGLYEWHDLCVTSFVYAIEVRTRSQWQQSVQVSDSDDWRSCIMTRQFLGFQFHFSRFPSASRRYCRTKRHGRPIEQDFIFSECSNFTKFGQLILRKIITFLASKCHILSLKCTKFDLGWGSAPDPAGGPHSAPPDH